MASVLWSPFSWSFTGEDAEGKEGDAEEAADVETQARSYAVAGVGEVPAHFGVSGDAPRAPAGAAGLLRRTHSRIAT